jgi:hypothetical protein
LFWNVRTELTFDISGAFPGFDSSTAGPRQAAEKEQAPSWQKGVAIEVSELAPLIRKAAFPYQYASGQKRSGLLMVLKL